MDLIADDYCRAIESYLCRKNDGHLIRIVGPAFDAVCGWAARGVPLKVACRGIDRYFERYYAKGTRRRPVRVEFCEADILDVFDEWRRAVGVTVVRESADASEGEQYAADEPGRGQRSLKAHLERALARLRAIPVEAAPAAAVASATELVNELLAASALRGEARRAALERLRAADEMLLQAARAACDANSVTELTAEAESELAPFRSRMPQDAYDQSLQACLTRLVRERYRLPVLTFDP
jgi:hypothetical protein